MSTRQRVDLEVFQTFLANAFAVQESGLDRRSLSALIEVQRLIANNDVNADAAMQMIADRALGVSHASGVAIGLLEPKRNELVYKAGSGNAAKDVGRRVPAVLSASSTPEMRREILRVENAASDTRIEAEICRQFGAMSLVMLPIYKDRILVGVLQVLFDGAHSFPERELRAYRLMAAALEEAMLRSARRAQKAAEVLAVIEQLPEQEALPLQKPPIEERAPETLLATAHRAAQDASQENSSKYPDLFAQFRAESFHSYLVLVVREAAKLRSRLTGSLRIPEIQAWSGTLRNPAVAVGVVMLSIAIWIGHRSWVGNENIDLSGGSAHDADLHTPAKHVIATELPTSAGSESSEEIGLIQGFKLVRVGPNEVDYISQDVTIRKFEPIHPGPQIRRTGKEVSFGDDVTVRYFAKPAVASQSSGTSDAPANDQ